MKLHGEIKHDVSKLLELTAPKPALSEAMIKRDNFFHSCWVKLKLARPDIWQDMEVVELEVAGFTPPNLDPDPVPDLTPDPRNEFAESKVL
jgi:hypothetical protein